MFTSVSQKNHNFKKPDDFIWYDLFSPIFSLLKKIFDSDKKIPWISLSEEWRMEDSSWEG